MREYIINHGGRVAFNARLTDIVVRDGAVTGARISRRDGAALSEEDREVSAIVLAVGHSARDTFAMLLSRGAAMSRKDFAVGVRIEHLQSEIGLAQYGKAFSLLPAADYRLVSHASERAAFTFCMCPGGYVMPAASEEGGVVTNGMSNYARDGINANSALVVQVSGGDFPDDSPLAGVEFQRRLERAAFSAGGGRYSAPVQLVGDFLRDRESSRLGSVAPTYPVSPAFADLRTVLPPFVVSALKAAIPDMDRRLKGFAAPGRRSHRRRIPYQLSRAHRAGRRYAVRLAAQSLSRRRGRGVRGGHHFFRRRRTARRGGNFRPPRRLRRRAKIKSFDLTLPFVAATEKIYRHFCNFTRRFLMFS